MHNVSNMIKHLSKKKKILKISWNDHKSTKSRKLVKKNAISNPGL